MSDGQFRDWSVQKYNSKWEFERCSGLKMFNECRKDYVTTYVKKVRRAATPSMILGTLVHSALLEDATNYVACDSAKTTGKYKDLALENPGKYVVSSKVANQIDSMVIAVREHPKASQLLNDRGFTEKSMTWTDDDTGLSLKCRLDRITSDVGIVDIKTSASPSKKEWGYQVKKYGYDLQCAMYSWGVTEAVGQPSRFDFIVIGSAPPYLVRVTHLPQVVVGSSRHRLSVILRELAACKESGVYLVQKDETESTETEMPSSYYWEHGITGVA